MKPRARWGPTCCILLLTFPLSAVFGPRAWGQQDERAVRAAFVYNLTKYVEWPQPQNDLVVGIVGNGDVADTLEAILTGKSSGSRTLRVLRNPNQEQLGSCDLLYFLDSSPKKLRPILEMLRGRSVLSVGEDERFAKRGGMVGLVRVGDHIQIQINRDAVQQSGLKISSRLLNLATIVRTEGGQ